MTKIISWLGLVLFTFIPLFSAAQTPIFPAGCMATDFTFKDKQLILAPKLSQGQRLIFLLTNVSREPIFLDHPPARPGTASAGWMSQLDPSAWSALAVVQPNFNWTCQRVGQADLKYLPCSQMLRICRYTLPIAQLNPKLVGEYWLGENQNLSNLLSIISLRGVKLPSS